MALLPFIFITQSKLPSCFDCLLHFRDSLYTLTHTKYFLFVWMCVWVLNINHECVRTHTNTHNTEQNLFRIIWKDSYKFIPSTFFGCFSTSYFAFSFTLCTFLLNSSQRCCVCVSVCMRFKENFLRKADIFDCSVCVCVSVFTCICFSIPPSSVFCFCFCCWWCECFRLLFWQYKWYFSHFNFFIYLHFNYLSLCGHSDFCTFKWIVEHVYAMAACALGYFFHLLLL